MKSKNCYAVFILPVDIIVDVLFGNSVIALPFTIKNPLLVGLNIDFEKGLISICIESNTIEEYIVYKKIVGEEISTSKILLDHGNVIDAVVIYTTSINKDIINE